MEIWLQRLTITIHRDRKYNEKICQKVNDPTEKIWNSEWLQPNLKKLIDDTSIIDETEIDTLPDAIEPDEVKLFNDEYP